MNMSTQHQSIVMSVFVETWPANISVTQPSGCSALLLQSGKLHHNEQTLSPGCGAYVPSQATVKTTEAAQLIRFSLSAPPTTEDEQTPLHSAIQQTTVLSSTIDTTLTTAILRLDQVDFPPAAVAWRHTHPGAGIRYLVQGRLQVEGDHATQQIEAGQAWFEDADSPVRATADSAAATSFVRLMVLPPEYEGKPTLNILSADDAKKPRLQSNTRYLDELIDLRHIN